MTNLFFVILLAAVQGLTEFLPVSSTGHLIVLEKFFNLSSALFGLSFDIALHLGTLLSLLLYFRKKLIKLIIDLFEKKTRLFWLIIGGTIPALIIGALFEPLIRDNFRSPLLVAFNLVVFSFIFVWAEKKGNERKEINQLSFSDAFFIGLFQATALLPGASRSGMTIAGGVLRNLKKNEAGEFAFLLSIPIILIALVKSMVDLSLSGFSQILLLNFIVGVVVSFIVGYLVIYYFLNFLKKHGLLLFIVYRFFLALLIWLVFK